MGIDRYIGWIKETYPDSIKEINGIKHYDYIYIDINHILHNSMHDSKTIDHFISNINYYLDHIFNNFIATKKIVLAVDGASPYSKIILQRKRRLDTLKHTDSTEEIENDNQLTSLQLTPGTNLMNTVTNFLHTYIKKIQSNHKLIKLDYTISSTDEPNEGELKVFAKLKENSINNKHASHLIIGNDADILVMAMSMKPIYNIDVMLHHKSNTNLISIKSLMISHAKLVSEISDWPIDPKIYFNIYNLIDSNMRDDFCIISIMNGNDYLPKLSFTKTATIWKAYIKTKNNKFCHNNNLINNDIFNIDFLKQFMLTLKNSLAVQYRKFNFKKYNKEKVKNYLEGLLWCLNMYKNGSLCCYDYIYNYNNGITVLDIYYYIEIDMTHNIKVVSSNVKPLNTYACMLLLIPKKMKHLVPNQFQHLIDNDLTKLGIYDEEECSECNTLKSTLSESYRNKNKDKNITEISKLLTLHKNKHRITVDTIYKVDELATKVQP